MNEYPDGASRVAEQQQAMLAAILRGPAESPGLRAYRANAQASAERALGAACPTVAALIGADDFVHLAREFWQAHPPQCGDLGEWGAELPAFLEAHASLREWPYLGDCARLDLALHRCERAADADIDAASLALLSSADPAKLQLRLRPGVQPIVSRWPVGSIHAAHATNDEVLFDAARAALQAERGEAVVVARDGWRARVQGCDNATAAFMQALLARADLSRALDAAGAGFDFAAWLAAALQHRWLQKVALLDGPSATLPPRYTASGADLRD